MKTLRSPCTLRELISLQRVMRTKALKMTVKCCEGGAFNTEFRPLSTSKNLSPERRRSNEKGKGTPEENDEEDDELEDGVADDVLNHGARDQRLGPSIRLASEEILGGHLRGEGERGESVHDQIHPEHLHGLPRVSLKEEERP